MSIFYLISKLRNIKLFFFLMFGNFMFFFVWVSQLTNAHFFLWVLDGIMS